MKSFLIALLSFFTISTLIAQSHEVTWGGEYRRTGGLYSNFFLAGLTDDAYHMLLYSRRETTLFSYDWNHRLIDTKSVAFGSRSDETTVDRFIRTKNSNFAVLNKYDRRARELRTYVSRFEQQGFAELQQIGTQALRVKDAEAVTESIRSENSPLSTSPDGSRVLFTQSNASRLSNANRQRRESEEITVSVFDADFQPQWNNVFLLPYADFSTQVMSSAVSNTGEVYLLVRVWKEFAERRQNAGLPPYRYELFKISANGDTQKLEIDLGLRLAPQYAGLYIPESSSYPVVVAGMYTDLERRSNLKGAFIVEVNDNFTLGKSSTQEFSSTFLEDLVSNRANRRNRGLDSDFVIKSFVRFADGKLGFLAEETYTVTTYDTTGPSMTTRTRTIYHTNQIVIVTFSPDGELVAIQKIDKTFDTYTALATSFATAVVDDQLFIVYNDEKTRQERREIRGKGGRGALFTDLTILDNTGTIARQESLFTSDATDRKFFVPRQSGYNSDYMVFVARSAKFFQCGIMRLR